MPLDNPLEIATKFVHSKGLSEEFIPQIVEFVESTLKSRTVSALATAPIGESRVLEAIPLYESANTDGILRKLREFGDQENTRVIFATHGT